MFLLCVEGHPSRQCVVKLGCLYIKKSGFALSCTVRIHQFSLATLKCLQPRAAELCPVRLSGEGCRRRVQCPSVCPFCGSLDLEQLLVSINSHLSSRLRRLCCYELTVRLRAKKREGHLPRPGIILCQIGEHLFAIHTMLFPGHSMW